MPDPNISQALSQLRENFEGELRLDSVARKLYATDASVYEETPLAVAIPKSEDDIRKLILFARDNGTSLIPRTAGTSLSGQVVGTGIVVDVSQHFTEILEINAVEGWARVQPGVIRNELNMALRPHGLLFGPETSTQNRAMIGGMVGNNSCGSNSIVYGSTRDHTLELRGFLSDGSEATFCEISDGEFLEKCRNETSTLEAKIYRETRDLLSRPEARKEITQKFPKPEITRRNTGYAIDLLMDASPLATADKPSDRFFDFCQLLAGSEGTLFFTTEIKVRCLPLPPPITGLVCAHFQTVDEALRATQIAVKHTPFACELIDHFILEGAGRNIAQRENMSFVQGQPGAILVTELRGDTDAQVANGARALEAEMRGADLGYHFPVLQGQATNKVWDLRKAGLGIIGNVPGDTKPVAVIEDTAVSVDDLPEYIAEVGQTLKEKYELECVHYAHAGTGEIHLRPILNLKTEEGNQQFRNVASDIADIVKKYRGSLSGEHGDGRLRGEFLERMIGEANYEIVRKFKSLWDPNNIFNPGKIVDTPPMNSSLRYRPGQDTPEYPTVFNFSESEGVLRAAELCSGSGDCRKTQLTGGTMCPSYMATRAEADTTRARANILRRGLTDFAAQQGAKSADDPIGGNPFDNEEIKEVMDLCLSCKGCKRECPSNVDIAKLKAEFLQGYYDANGVPFRARIIAGFAKNAAWASRLPGLFNFVISNPLTAGIAKTIAGIAPARSLPLLSKTPLKTWHAKRATTPDTKQRKVWLFCDEFTNFNDSHVGIAAVELLEALGYSVGIPDHTESGRAAISKGLLRDAKAIAEENVRKLKPLISEESPLIGIEPSAILSFRDEYPDLVSSDLRTDAQTLAANCLTVEEFIEREVDAQNISPDQFTTESQAIRLHGHCHQKALSSLAPTVRMLQLPTNYSVRLIPSGCCGMAGSFGYEKEHYDLSMQIGELVLFPAVRSEPESTLIAAPGTSCRHQILDGTGRTAMHPVEILRDALPM